jgi:hypothetical protein
LDFKTSQRTPKRRARRAARADVLAGVVDYDGGLPLIDICDEPGCWACYGGSMSGGMLYDMRLQAISADADFRLSRRAALAADFTSAMQLRK